MIRALFAVVLAAAAAMPAVAADNVLMITYDGLRLQELFGGADEKFLSPRSGQVKDIPLMRQKYWADTPEERRELLLPFFWNVVAKDGQVYGNAELDSPTIVGNGRYFSYPGYNELLSGIADTGITSNAKRNNENVTVLEWLNGKEPYKGRVAAFTSWDVFPFIINTERSGVPVNAAWEGDIEGDSERVALLNEVQDETPHYWGGVRFDVFTYHAAVEHIKNNQPRVIYISFGETDDWAHDGRYDMYLESARRTDAYIERLWNLLQSMEQYKDNTALILSTDHGRGDSLDEWKSHGADIPGCDRIWMALYGAGVEAKGQVEGVETTQSQYAATAAKLLGEAFAATNDQVADPINY